MELPLACPVLDLIFVDPPRNDKEGCRRRSNCAPDYTALEANIKTQHSGILLSNGI